MKVGLDHLLTEEIIEEIASRYNISKDDMDPRFSYENFLFTVRRDDEDYYLRIAHSRYNSIAAVQGELEWIAYLRDNGVAAVEVQPSIGGNDIEVYSSDGDDFICVLFRKLEGVNFTEDQTLLTSDRMEQWGALVGRIHRLSSELSGQIPRQHWHEDMLVAQRTDVLKDYPTILSRVNKVVSQISTLEKTQSSYGLIHQDLHEANLIIHQDTMTIIDFDDCIYHYYLYDIAAILFHYAWRFGGADRRDEVIAEFFPHFIAGYRTEFSYDDSQRDLLLLFVKHRHHCLFSTLAYELAIEEDDWSRKIHDGWKHCLEDDMDWISPEVLKLG